MTGAKTDPRHMPCAHCGKLHAELPMRCLTEHYRGRHKARTEGGAPLAPPTPEQVRWIDGWRYGS